MHSSSRRCRAECRASARAGLASPGTSTRLADVRTRSLIFGLIGSAIAMPSTREEVQMDGRLERLGGDAPDAAGVLGHRHRAASRRRRRGQPVAGQRDGRGLRRTDAERDRAVRMHLGRDERVLRSAAAAGRRRRRGGGRLRHLSGDKLAESERAGSERRNPATCHRAPDSSGVRRFLAARARLGRRDPILRAGARLCHLSTGTRHHRPLRRGILGASTGTSLFNAVARSI